MLNSAQAYLHHRAEDQLARTGRVRLIVLKGRQQGISTYTQARMYWRATHRRGHVAFILTHDNAATNAMWTILQRTHREMNSMLRPATKLENAKELSFGGLDSGFLCGTAGSKAVGRGRTVQLFHGSEVAFWPNAGEHLSGMMQAIPDEPGTEVFLESTANGVGDTFHQAWRAAVRGEGPYEAVFIPWYWQDEYQTDASAFVTDDATRAYQEANNLKPEQMAWRASKIAEFGGDEARFRREYPAYADEAFIASADMSFIPPALVQVARKAKAVPQGPRLLGVDPARFGDDMTAFCERQGRVVKQPVLVSKRDTMEIAGLVKKQLDEGIDFAFVDVIGVGAGVVDRLREMGYGPRIIAVNAGNSALDEAKYYNLRAEMYGNLREWLKEQPAQLPDDDALQADLCAANYTYTSNSQYKLERKDDLKKRLGHSPDRGDALALTFAEPVAGRRVFDASKFNKPVQRTGHGWM